MQNEHVIWQDSHGNTTIQRLMRTYFKLLYSTTGTTNNGYVHETKELFCMQHGKSLNKAKLDTTRKNKKLSEQIENIDY